MTEFSRPADSGEGYDDNGVDDFRIHISPDEIQSAANFGLGAETYYDATGYRTALVLGRESLMSLRIPQLSTNGENDPLTAELARILLRAQAKQRMQQRK